MPAIEYTCRFSEIRGTLHIQHDVPCTTMLARKLFANVIACLPAYLKILVTVDRLQRVMNAAARMLCSVGRRTHVPDLLRNRLHWLRVPQRFQFKLCLLMYKALHGMAPDWDYLREVCWSVSEDDAPGSLRSAERGDLIVPRAATKFGDRAFAISGPLMWNSLPTTVRNSSTLSNFKSALKSHLFTGLFSRLHQQLVTICDGALESVYMLWRHRNYRRIIIIIIRQPMRILSLFPRPFSRLN